MIEIELPYPPTVNHYKRIGRMIKTKRGKIYQQRLDSDKTKSFYYNVWIKVRSLIGSGAIKSFADATISVEIDVYPPDKRKRDIDGILKVCLDSMQKAGLYDDDYQIARLLVTRMPNFPQGKIIVRITEYVT